MKEAEGEPMRFHQNIGKIAVAAAAAIALSAVSFFVGRHWDTTETAHDLFESRDAKAPKRASPTMARPHQAVIDHGEKLSMSFSEAMSALVGASNQDEKTRILWHLAMTHAKARPEAVYAAVREHAPERKQFEIFASMFPSLAATHADLVIKWFDELPTGAPRTTVLRRFAGAMVNADYEKLIDWSKRTAIAEDVGEVASALYSNEVNYDLRKVYAQLGDATLPSAISETLAAVYGRGSKIKSKDDLESLLNKAASFSPPVQAKILEHALTDAPTDIFKGVDSKHLPQAPEVQRAWLRGAVREMYKTSPQTAADWVISMDAPEEDRNEAAGILTTWWANENSEAASRWIAGLPEGSLRDAAASDLVIHLSLKKDRVAAESWLRTIKDPKAHRRAEANMPFEWRK